MPLIVQTKVELGRIEASEVHLKKFASLLLSLADDMGDQVRLNVVRFGKPGGDGGWAPVSGFRQGKVVQQKRAAQTSAALARQTTGDQAKRHRTDAKRHRAVHKRLKAAGASAHSAYAKRKEDGKTPGHGKFHADELLRDTEDLFASFRGVVSTGGRGTMLITLHAEGTAPGRTITNQRLLEIHAEGEGDMPKRDPTSDMSNYEKRLERRLRDFWDRMFGAE